MAVQNVLIEAYAEAGKVDVARKMFDEMRERYVVSWNPATPETPSTPEMECPHGN